MAGIKIGASLFSGNKLIKDKRGFSIVELGVVLIIGALMMVPIYSLLFYVSDVKPTDQRLEIVQEALAEHLRVTGALPIPANPALSMDDPNAFIENSSAVAVDNVYIGALPMKSLKAAVACTNATGTKVSGTEGLLKSKLFSIGEMLMDKNSNAGLLLNVGAKSEKIDGIRCPMNEYALDENGTKFIYAVSVNATTPETFNPLSTQSNLIIQNEAGNEIARPFYTIVSMGDDATGGYDRSGLQIGGSCPALTASKDAQNCDTSNAIFVDATHNLTNSADYYDDKLEYGIARFMSESSFWRWAAGPETGDGDVVLHNQTALLLNATKTDDTAISADDRLVIKDGTMKIDGELKILANGTSGGTLHTDKKLNVGGTTNVAKYAQAKNFCYPEKQSLFASCPGPKIEPSGGTTTVNCTGKLQDLQTTCDPTKDAYCCPTVIYNHTDPYSDLEIGLDQSIKWTGPEICEKRFWNEDNKPGTAWWKTHHDINKPYGKIWLGEGFACQMPKTDTTPAPKPVPAPEPDTPVVKDDIYTVTANSRTGTPPSITGATLLSVYEKYTGSNIAGLTVQYAPYKLPVLDNDKNVNDTIKSVTAIAIDQSQSISYVDIHNKVEVDESGKFIKFTRSRYKGDYNWFNYNKMVYNFEYKTTSGLKGKVTIVSDMDPPPKAAPTVQPVTTPNPPAANPIQQPALPVDLFDGCYGNASPEQARELHERGMACY